MSAPVLYSNTSPTWMIHVRNPLFWALQVGQRVHQSASRGQIERGQQQTDIATHTDPWLSQGAWWSAYSFMYFC